MSEPSRQPGPPARVCLASCLREVNVTRARLRATRNDLRSWEKPALRADLLAALEEYAEAITDLGAPVPRRLLAEIELYRRLRNRS